MALALAACASVATFYIARYTSEIYPQAVGYIGNSINSGRQAQRHAFTLQAHGSKKPHEVKQVDHRAERPCTAGTPHETPLSFRLHADTGYLGDGSRQRLGAACNGRAAEKIAARTPGDGPGFLLAWICVGAGLFFVGAVAYRLFRKRYWPTAIQKAHSAWLLSTQAAADATGIARPSNPKDYPHLSRQALSALSTADRLAVEQVSRTTQDATGPKDLHLIYKTRESMAWMWMLAAMMALVLWVGYELVWMGKTGTALWWAYLVLFVSFTLVLGVLPLSMLWTELAARRSGAPAWTVNAIGIGLGKNMNFWPQIEEIRLLEVAQNKKAPLVLVALKRHGDTETKYFPNIDPVNVKLCFSDVSPNAGSDKSVPFKEIMLPKDAKQRAATLAAILRYQQHFAQVAFAAEWQAYRAADT